MQFLKSSELHKVGRAIDSTADFEYIKAEIDNKRSAFVDIQGTYYVLRVDSDGLVVLCAQGANIKQSSHVIVALAKRLNCPAIYFHTKRPALARLLKHCNFNFFETDPDGLSVYRMLINE
jgi:hypothetical protein